MRFLTQTPAEGFLHCPMRPRSLLRNKWSNLFNVIPVGIDCSSAECPWPVSPHCIHWVCFIISGSQLWPCCFHQSPHSAQTGFALAGKTWLGSLMRFGSYCQCLPNDRWDETLMTPVWKLGQHQRERRDVEK